MVDSFYHRTFKSLKKLHFWRDNLKIVPSSTQRYDGCHYVTLLNL